MASKSVLEEKFDAKWNKIYPEIKLLREYKLLKDREFKGDFAHPDSKTVIEIQLQLENQKKLHLMYLKMIWNCKTK